MRDLKKYTRECIEELKGIGIFPGNILGLEINTRAKKRLGSCTPKYGKGRNIIGYDISVNGILLDERYPEKALKNTIIHELLHSCEGCMSHRNRWKELAEKVRRELGYDIQRLSSKDHEGIPFEAGSQKPRYMLQCQKCGQIYTRKRCSKVVQHPERYLCGKCKGKLVEIK